MLEEKGDGVAGPLRKQPGPLDAWFCWIAGLATAALIGFCLVSVFHLRPADSTSAAHYHPHAVG